MFGDVLLIMSVSIGSPSSESEEGELFKEGVKFFSMAKNMLCLKTPSVGFPLLRKRN